MPSYQETIHEMALEHPGLDITVVVPKRFKMGKLYRAKQGYTSFNYVPLNAPFSSLGAQHFFFYLGLIKVFRRIKPDIVWAQAPNSLNTTQITLLSFFFGFKIVLLRFTNYYRNYWKLYGWLNLRSYLYSFNRMFNYHFSSAVVTIDELVTQTVQTEKFKGVIYEQMTMGVSQKFFVEGNSNLEQRPKVYEIRELLFIGRFVKNKGLDILIKSVGELVHKGYKIRLTLIGEGPEKNSLSALVGDLKLEHYVLFCPFVDYSKVPETISKYDLSILPSIQYGLALEQFGRTVVESKACGVPVVASNLGGIPNALGKYGNLVEPGNQQALTEGIESYLIDLDLYNSDRIKGMNEAYECFSDRQVGSKLGGFFTNL